MTTVAPSRPTSWIEKPLRAVCEPTAVWNPAREPRDEFWYIDVSAVSRQSFAIHNPQRVKAPTAPSRARKIIRSGDAIFATVRPTLRRVALVGSEFDNQIASTAFCVVRADRAQAAPRFLYYLLLTDSLNEEIAKFESGASYPAVNDKHVLDRTVLIPPKREQEKIAAVLWKIQRAIEVEEKLIATTRELKQAAMRQLFTRGLRGERQKQTEIGSIPESWQVRPFADLREFLQYGTSAKCDYANKGNPVIRIPNVADGRVSDADLKWCELNERETESLLLQPGDVLFIRTNGVRERVGTCAVYLGVPERALFASYLIRARIKQDVLDPAFFQYFTSTAAGTALLGGRASPAADGKFNVNTKLIDSIFVPVPEVGEQREIAQTLQIVDKKIAVHERKRATLQELFKAMLHQLMTGQIRVDKLDIDVSEVQS